MLAPERRTRADIFAAVAIAVAVAAAAIVVWARADVTGTESATAETPVTTPVAATALPSALRELWSAADTTSRRALVSGGVVVTGEDGTVSGRDPVTGEQVWWYRRDMPLCALESQFGMVIAVYRDQRGCSQVTMLDGDTGARRGARSSYSDPEITLTGDGTYLLARGAERLELWRSDLVRTLEYGYVDAPVNPRTQPRKDCELLSGASSSARLAVLERCPDDPSNRLTVLTPAPKDSTVPEEQGSHVLTEPGADSPDARVVATSDTKIAVYLPPAPATATGPETPPRLAIYDASGNPVTTHRLTAPLTKDTATTRIAATYYVFTGDGLIALSAATMDVLWSVSGVLGPPASMAGDLLVPVPDGVLALDPQTGATVTRIPVTRGDYHGGPISTAVVGTTVVERRGDRTYALG
ncbi:Rv3212 family protein [Nocardia thailandica]